MTESHDESARATRCPHREVREIVVGGRFWRVYEREDRYDRRRGCMLVLESNEVLRFVRQFPSNWRELSDQAIYELSLVK